MSKSRIDLSASKISNISEIQNYGQQLKKGIQYQKASNNELIQQNKRILQILKNIQSKIDKQLQVHKKNMLSTNPYHKVVFNKDQMRLLQDKQSNNNKLISVLQRDMQNIKIRKRLHEQGYEQKIRQKKNNLQDKINIIKQQIKKLQIQQKQVQKRLKANENLSQTDYLKQYMQMQQQLRIYSAKYVKILSRYTKVTDQLAVASQIQPQFQIPQEIYNNDLDQKQQAQYKQYQSIVKLCTILSKRNDSQNNKNNRLYTQKLKQLQKTILNLTQLQNSISIRQTQILQGKKNIQMIRYKLSNQQKVDKQLFRLSQGSKNSFGEQLRKKSYSSVKLIGFVSNYNENEFNSSTNNNSMSNNNKNKLRNRGMSFVKLPQKISKF